MIKIVSPDGKPVQMPKVTIEVIDDPPDREENIAALEAHRRNTNWLQYQWPWLLPQARGKYVVVADQEAFIAATREEAIAWIKANHPNDPGAFWQYVPSVPVQGARCYAHRG
jgi:hypothetical protein